MVELYNDAELPQKTMKDSIYTTLNYSKKNNILPYSQKELLNGDLLELNLDINYFQSKLDGKIEKYFIRKLIGYDENKKYSLFLYISIGNSCDYHPYLIHNNDYFIAEALGRGITGGSSIRDVSVLEVLSLILNKIII